MRKRFCLILTVLLCLAAHPSRAEESRFIGELQSYESRLKLRKHASTSSEVLGQYFAGTRVTVHSVDDGWAKVSIGDREGYMMSEFLLPAGSQPPLTPPDGMLTSAPYGRVTVHARPDASSPARACELSGISVMGTVGDDWLHVTVRLMNGSDHSGFVPSNRIAQYMVDKLRVDSDSPENLVNLREAPSRNASALGRLFAGTRVELLFDDHVAHDGWSKVRVGDLVGYIMDDYLTLESPPLYSVPMTEIRSSHVPTYSRADGSGPLEELGRYDPFYVLGIFGERYYVRIETWLTETVYGDRYAFVAREDMQQPVTRSGVTLGFLREPAQLLQLDAADTLMAGGEWKREGDVVTIWGSTSAPGRGDLPSGGHVSPEDAYLYVSYRDENGEEIMGYLPVGVVEFDEALVMPVSFVVG